jgi:spore photoproduct lyase
MYKNIFVEKQITDHPRVKHITDKLKSAQLHSISKVEDYWGRVKKPYLQKRTEFNLYIGEKRGQLVKRAPDAYGVIGLDHYYFIHTYNCIYECQYCYLQGYFNTPDMVIFINHEEILTEIENIINTNSNPSIWFHAGEYSDSLALSHLTNELELYFDFFKNNPSHYLELRTKSVNIRELKKLKALDNIITSFSLAPAQVAKEIDLKTPGVKTRIKAMQELQELGHPLGIHFDPIYYFNDFAVAYEELIIDMADKLDFSKVHYVSLGVVRFTKDVYREFSKNYPESNLLKANMKKSFDGKVRYQRPMRLWMMNKVKQLLINHGMQEDKIYLCMESNE